MRSYGFVERHFEFRGESRCFVVYVPREYQALRPIPTILFLHGRGESGDDGLKPLVHGVPRALLFNRKYWPFLVVIPQKPLEDRLWPEERDFLNMVLQQIEEEFEVNPHQRYLTGLSQGGNGTFVLAKKLHWQFAAIAPVCGWCDPDHAAKELKDMPLWAFHGAKDTAVQPSGSTLAVEAIRQAGGDPKLTLYPEVGHDAWTPAYNDPELPKWLLSHSLV